MFIKYLQLRRAFSGFCQKKRPAQSGSHGSGADWLVCTGKAPPDKLQRQKNQKNGQQCRRCIQANPIKYSQKRSCKESDPAVRAGGIRTPFSLPALGNFQPEPGPGYQRKGDSQKAVSTGLADQLCG